MIPSPRVLLSIDYEPWFALTRRYDNLTDHGQRRDLDGGFTLSALDPILEQLGGAKISFYLVGEVSEWYPEIPQKIVAAGHELGLHCQFHRKLHDINELKADLQSSLPWRKRFHVRGFRTPMITISEDAYPLLQAAGFSYSSSIYAPAGTVLQKDKLWEFPVSTLKVFGPKQEYHAPRDYSLRLLASGEFPYGSSFSVGILDGLILKILERELKAGRSPVMFLHPYELVAPSNWPGRILPDLMRHPLLWPFTWNKAGFLAALLRNFPVSPLATYYEDMLASKS